VGDVAEVAAAADESDGCKRSSQGIEEAFVGEQRPGSGIRRRLGRAVRVGRGATT
jgi:hypothetical protein